VVCDGSIKIVTDGSFKGQHTTAAVTFSADDKTYMDLVLQTPGDEKDLNSH